MRLQTPVPIVGNQDFEYAVHLAAPNRAVLFAVGFAVLPQPLVGGCTLYVQSPAAFFTVTSGRGIGCVLLRIPDNPELLDLQLVGQAAVLDGQGPILGLSFTQALRVVIGQ